MLLFTVRTKTIGAKSIDIYNNKIEIVTKTRDSKTGRIIIPFKEVITKDKQKELLQTIESIYAKQMDLVKEGTLEKEDIFDIYSLAEYLRDKSKIRLDLNLEIPIGKLGRISIVNIQKLMLTGYEEQTSITEGRYTLEMYIERSKSKGTTIEEWREYPSLKKKTTKV